LPSSQTSAGSGGLVSGVADIAFVNGTLYALINGAGCSHGLKGTVNGVIRANADGTTAQIADLSTFWQSHPIKNPDPADPEPDSTPYSMIEVNGKLYVLDPHNAELDEVTTDGKIRRLIDISDSQGHIVPTSVMFHDGVFYVANLHKFPIHIGAARLYQITLDGEISVLPPKLTAVLGIAFDEHGQLFALEMSTKDNSNPTPGTGRVVRVTPQSESVEVIASGFTFPTAMTFGPDGMLYVSNFGFGFPPGKGEIVRLEIPA
jgi:sugar lactone lactonase YvrE